MKLRGIAVRRGDTTGLVKRLQGELLEGMARCVDGKEFLENIPAVLGTTRRFVEEIRSGSVPLEQLVITKRVSREVEEYSDRKNESLDALKQLKAAGFRVPPGEMIEYVVLAKDRRTRPAQFLDGDEAYDEGKYVDLVLRATSELLAPFGYDLERMRAEVARPG
jgi:DNA polymerase elongation subunit (family B)